MEIRKDDPSVLTAFLDWFEGAMAVHDSLFWDTFLAVVIFIVFVVVWAR